MSTYFFYHCLHKVQPVRLTDGLFESEGIRSCLYVGGQGVSEVGDIFWIGPGSLFMVEQTGCKTCYLWKNRICRLLLCLPSVFLEVLPCDNLVDGACSDDCIQITQKVQHNNCMGFGALWWDECYIQYHLVSYCVS